MKTSTTPIAPTTRHATFRLLAALFFLCLFAPVAMGEGDTYWQDQISGVDKIANENGATGGKDDPILIASRDELIYFAKQVNNRAPINLGSGGKIEHDGREKDRTDKDPDWPYEGYDGYYFALTTDIDLKEHYWTPIGYNKYTFKGCFDGGGHCVSGLKVKVTSEGKDVYAGLFGKAEYSILLNLGVSLDEAGIRANSMNGIAYAGGIAGMALNIHNCYVVGPGTVEAVATNTSNKATYSYAGGIAGYIFNYPLPPYSILTHCYATVDVKAEGNFENYAGGIVGRAPFGVSLSYTYATGAVEVAGNAIGNYAGGICGYAPSGGENNITSLSNNLALNKSIKGCDEEKWSNRIVGYKGGSYVTLTSNYASPEIPVNGSRVSPDQDGLNGTDTWLDTFEEDLKGASPVNNEWNATDTWTWISGYLPQLNIFGNNQPKIEASSAFSLKDLSLGETTGEITLTYDGKKWLYNEKGSENPTIPFSGTVKGEGSTYISPITIVTSNSPSAPTLTFKGVFLTTDGTCLTVNDKVVLTLKLEDTNGLINTGNTDNTGVAIDNKGTLTLAGDKLFMFSPASSTIGGKGQVAFNNSMLEWQFAEPLYGKVFTWGTSSDPTLISVINENGTASSVALVVANEIEPLKLLVRSDNLSSPVTQQYFDGNNYTTSFTPQPGQRTVFTDVKDCPCLHLEQPTGGDLTVTDKDKTQLFDGAYVPTGTLLTLSCPPKDNYIFESYLCGTAADNLTDLPGNVVTIGEFDLWLSARLRYEKPADPPYIPPVPVYYSVYLPPVEGATTDPVPGEYKVESWDSFRFYLTIDTAYSQSHPIVTTSRGETLEPRTSDGAYLVKYVRCDVEIFIDGLIKNDPVANEAIAPADALVPQIWAEGSMLCIRMAEALPSAPVRIFTVDGRLHASFASTPGLNRRQLPTGMYIVRVGNTVRKVIIR